MTARHASPWLSGLFWKYALGVLVVSYAGTLLLIMVELATHAGQVQRAFDGKGATDALRARSADLATELPAATARPATCRALLEAILARLIERNGELYNMYGSATVAPPDGGWLIGYRDARGSCRWPPDANASLRAALDRNDSGATPGGDVRIATIALADDAMLTLAFRPAGMVDAYLSMQHDESASLVVYLGIISLFCALALAVLLVRRIRRAERAADAWAAGRLDARVGETSRDEFGRLAQRFDRMADALAEQIGVKQALAAADERNRLARDLHDTAKQRCFALGLQLSVLRHRAPRDPALLALVDAVISLASRLQNDLDDVIRRVGAPAIAEHGLRRTLEHALELLLRDSGLSWSLALDAADETTLARHPSLAAQLLLIVNEAAANALRHSRARALDVAIARRDGVFTCVVADDGDGFDPAMARAGMGLANQRARAAMLPRGGIAVDSAPGRGTRVVVTFTLERTISA